MSLDVMTKETVIPPLESPYGPGAWNQPPRESILVDATHALMTEATFKQLAEYSTTKPSGVYPGKMWRRHDGAFTTFNPRTGVYERSREPPVWLLCWYGLGPTHDVCSVNFREIILL